MPTIRSRPDEDDGSGEEAAYTPNEVVDMIQDAVLYVMPRNMLELKLALHVACRTLWNADAVSDFYVHEVKGGACDVGFRLHGELHYNVVQIN